MSEVQLSQFSRARRTILILALSGLWTVGPFAIDLYLPALPTVSRDLGASTQDVALTVTAFAVGLALGQLLAAPLSDSYGRRRPLLLGLTVFTLTSLVATLAPSVEVLIAVRLVQGMAGAAGMATANAVVTDVTEGREAARLLSRMALIGGLAPIVAPVVGARLLQVMSWRGLFAVLTGIGLTLVVGIYIGLRESNPPERRSAKGVGGIGRSMATLSRDAGFMAYTLIGAMTSMAFFAYLAASSFVYQGLYAVSATTFSLLYGLNAVGLLAGSAVNHRLLARFTARQLLGASLVVAAVAGVTTLGVLAVGGRPVWLLVAPLFVLISSFGFAWPNCTALALATHPEIAGSASAFNGAFRMGLASLATVLVGIGGEVAGLPTGLVIASATVVALALFVAMARGTRVEGVVDETAEEASANIPVG